MRYSLEKECFGDPANQAIFMIPNWATPKESLSSLAKELSAEFYVVLVNLPGVSVTPEGIDMTRLGPNYDVDAVAGQLISVAPKGAWWIGWALGGMLATYVAARRSSRLKGLITMGMSPKFIDQDGDTALTYDKCLEMAELLEKSPAEALQACVQLQSQGSSQSVANALGNWMNPKNSNRMALMDGFQLLLSLKVRRELEILDVPSLHLIGTDDQLIDANWVNNIVNEFYPIEGKLMASCSHQPFLDDLSGTCENIKEFICSHELS